MKAVYSRRYELVLPGHIWPTAKYRLIAERVASRVTLVEPTSAPWDDLALVHTSAYLRKLRENSLSASEIGTLELPWQPAFGDVFRLMAGGTIEAARAALADGAAVHLGGGLHHAFANHGEGFCPLNDVAVAVRVLQRSSEIRRAAIVDLDVHHGNGTAMIFERDPTAFTFSMHQQHNYPMFKPRSDLDIGLADGTQDAEYLDRLASALPRVFTARPQLVLYVAGADPYQGDRLGGLALSKRGLRERDRLVVDTARRQGVPLIMVLGGGYAEDVADTVDIHVGTIDAMLSVDDAA